MRYSNSLVPNEHIYRKVFRYNNPESKFDGSDILVTCAVTKVGYAYFFGFSVKSPSEKQMFRKRSLSPARGRLRKAIFTNNRLCFPKQRWIKEEEFEKFADEVAKKYKAKKHD